MVTFCQRKRGGKRNKKFKKGEGKRSVGIENRTRKKKEGRKSIKTYYLRSPGQEKKSKVSRSQKISKKKKNNLRRRNQRVEWGMAKRTTIKDQGGKKKHKNRLL